MFSSIVQCISRFLHRLFAGKPTFELYLKDGRSAIITGHLAHSFIQDCLEITQRHGITELRIFGRRRQGAISLEFDPEIMPACAQQIRNAWAFHRPRRG